MIRKIDPQRLEQAAAWRTRLGESPEEYADEHSSWVREDLRNREAWQAVQEPWESLGQHTTAPAIIRLRREALHHAYAAVRSNSNFAGRFRWRAIAAAAAVVVFALTVLLAWRQYVPDVYSTGAGERRTVTLMDGSQVTLDSRSEVTVRYTANARVLALLRGQARFDVAHDGKRPFRVAAGQHQVVATGTAFDVDMLGPAVMVTLIKGHVVVLPRNAPALPLEPTASASSIASVEPALNATVAVKSDRNRDWSRIALDPGQQLVLSTGATPRISRVDVDQVTAWERGEIVLDNESLASVVARINRYGSRQIIVGDEGAGALRISGVFHEGDTDGFISTLASYLPVQAKERPDGSVLLSSTTATGL